MPEIEIDAGQRRLAEEIVRHVRFLSADLSVEGRMLLAIELLRWFKPEYDELKRRVGNGG